MRGDCLSVEEGIYLWVLCKFTFLLNQCMFVENNF